MAGYPPARRDTGVIGSIEDWMDQRNADVRRLLHGAEIAGRTAWDKSTRTDQNLRAATPHDVVALGARILGQGGPPASPPFQPARPQAALRGASAQQQVPPASAKPFAQKAMDQVLAGARGAQDAFTFGVGDHAYAGAMALADTADGADFGQAYSHRMAIERARDRYDSAHYGLARGAGQVVGTGAQLALLGPLEGPVAGARLAQASPLIAREVSAIGSVGAAGGVGGQAISDLANGRLSSFQDYLGAGVGGGAGALASMGGRAGYAGAVDGATTSVAQDLFNGRVPSIAKARQAAGAAGLFGASAGRIGRAWSNGLSPREKGDLGENFSRLRNWARGDETLPGPKQREYLDGGGYTVPDLRTSLGQIVESKFGPKARLSPRQLQAYQEPLPNFRIDQSLPQDVGAIAGFPAAQYGYHLSQNDDWQ
jgi:hypothetical protein